MKKLLVFIICVTLFAFTPRGKSEKTYYYFCFSRSGDIAPDGSPIKQTIMYNKISSITAEDKSALKMKAKQWCDWVDNRCASKSRCTSDTNTYPSEENAEKAYEGFLSLYSDTSKFALHLVDFR